MRNFVPFYFCSPISFPLLPPDWCPMSYWTRTLQSHWESSSHRRLSTSSETVPLTLSPCLRGLTSMTSRNAEPPPARPVSGGGWRSENWKFPNSSFPLSSNPVILHRHVPGGTSQHDQWWEKIQHKAQVFKGRKGNKGKHFVSTFS